LEQPRGIELQWAEVNDDSQSDDGQTDEQEEDDDDENNDDDSDDDDCGNALPLPPSIVHTDAEAPPRKRRA
jgi:hypothetical protein